MVAIGLVTWAAHGAVLRGVQAALVLSDIAAGPAPSLFKSLTPAPARTAVSYAVSGRPHEADFYLPGGSPEAVIVVVPGALATGKDDPRLVAFASTLARARFAVFVPDIPAIRELRLRASDAQDIADAVTYLGTSKESAGMRVGIAALSYAVGPAILALLDPAIGAKVQFLLGVGGYYDADAVLTFFTTGYYRDPPDGPWRHRTPNAYGKWLFVAGNVALVIDPKDNDLLFQIAERKLKDLSADVSDLATHLGPEGGRILDFIDNTDPGQAPALIAALPGQIRAQIAALDLKTRDLSRLKTHLILIHGGDDAIIPESESEALDAAAGGKAELYIVQRLSHVDLGPVGAQDAVTLWRAVYSLLSERDATSPEGPNGN